MKNKMNWLLWVLAGLAGLVAVLEGQDASTHFSKQFQDIEPDGKVFTAGTVGVGTSTVGYNAGGLPLVVGNATTSATSNGLTIVAGTSATSAIHFADGTSGNESYRGVVSYWHFDDSMSFYTAGTLKATITSAGHFSSQATIKPKTYTVATLPAAATVGAGATAFASDGSLVHAGNSGAIVAGAGANFVPVYSDGTNWRIF